ncbi:mucin-like glycoprotein [Trypanosoma conorhini]|uniref:Mucin-like glycoprotein n=1 Tax=Trypanosoma conorhini TaxID=83891 RepID=A0A422N047_9TRYP|nr:mucin-like glycoprotein [Trypanosoma conorhini]RNE98817.1 mucin-like glycoprotein [Trypanosoma conorhini]
MNFFSCGCGALLRELSGLPPFSSLPLPALTLCAVPHRAPHFSLCFFFFAASQPTGSAAILLPPPPPPLFLPMALTVRRRAVCALALLALLCASVCGAIAEGPAANVNVSVEVSCPNTNDNKLRWRVAGEKTPTWKECPQAVKGAGGSETGAAGNNSLCIFAGSVFLEKFPTGTCPAPQPTEGTDAAAFTMNCTAAANSALHNLSKGQGGTISATEDPLGASGDCEFPTPSQTPAEVQTGSQPTEQQQTAGPQQQLPTQSSPQQLPAPSAPAKTEQEGNPSGVGRSVPKEPTAAAGQPGTAAGPTGSQESSAEGSRENTTPSVGTAASPAAAAGKAADGTTTTTTRSPSAGSHADSTATIATAWMRAPLLLLLLTAAIACTAGLF